MHGSLDVSVSITLRFEQCKYIVAYTKTVWQYDEIFPVRLKRERVITNKMERNAANIGFHKTKKNKKTKKKQEEEEDWNSM